MGWLIFSIIVVIGIFVGCGFYKKDRYDIGWKLQCKQFLALLGLLLMIPAFITKVPANSVGIKYSAFNGTDKNTLSEGFHFKTPFDKVYNISTEIQTTTVTNLTTQTHDAQYVTSTLDVKYRVNPTNAYLIFTQFRTLDKMSSSLIVPTTQRALELITTNYNVMDVLGEKRSEIYSALDVALSEELAKYSVEFISVSIVDMDAGEQIEAAITAEAVAKKAVETAEYELAKAQTEAKKAAVIAEAEKEAAKIKAETEIIEAEAEKTANELLQKSLTDLILRQQWIEKWDGVLPMYYGGEDSGLIFDTGSNK